MDSVQFPPVATQTAASPPSSGVSSAAPTGIAPPIQPPPPIKSTTDSPPPVGPGREAAAAAARAGATAQAETPAFSLNVGLIGGSFDVFVDVTDRDSHRFIARIYGPRGNVPDPAPITHLLTEA